MLTKRKAIKECKELWEEIEKGGYKSKDDFLNSDEGEDWLCRNYQNNCPLCEYAGMIDRNDEDCRSKCPLVLQYKKDCVLLGWSDYSFTKKWLDAIKNLK